MALVTDQNKAAAEARRKQSATARPIREELLRNYAENGDRTDGWRWADVSGWWRDAALLARLGPALANLFADANPTVVVGTQSRGTLLGGLVATHLGVGLVEIRKNDGPNADSESWRHRTTPPDYRDRHLTLGFPKRLLPAGERVLFVDDWIDTGGQALGAYGLIEDAGAHWIGAAVVVDGLSEPRLRRDLTVKSLLRNRELWAAPDAR
jgi:adenine phosphoribosyltransferase